MTVTRRRGLPSIFFPKDGGRPVRVGSLTKAGARAFDLKRKQLAALVRWPVARVSDADTVEFLLRGPEATAAYLMERGYRVK